MICQKMAKVSSRDTHQERIFGHQIVFENNCILHWNIYVIDSGFIEHNHFAFQNVIFSTFGNYGWNKKTIQ